MKKTALFLAALQASTLFGAGLQKVEIQIDNQPFVQANGLESWTYALDTAQLDNGSHMLMVKATDLSGNVSQIPMANFKVNNPAALYLMPVSEDVTAGDTFSVDVRMKTNPRVEINSVEAVVTFPSNVKATGVDFTNSAFNIQAEKTISAGMVKIVVGKTPPPLSGDQLVARITFQALVSGVADLKFVIDGADHSMILRNKDSKNILNSVTGASVNILEAADTTAPTVQIASPSEGQEVSDMFTISGTADDK